MKKTYKDSVAQHDEIEAAMLGNDTHEEFLAMVREGNEHFAEQAAEHPDDQDLQFTARVYAGLQEMADGADFNELA